MEEKPWWQSIAIWGQIVTLVSFAMKAFGLAPISLEEQQSLAQNITAMATSAGIVVGIIMGAVGRLRKNPKTIARKIL